MTGQESLEAAVINFVQGKYAESLAHFARAAHYRGPGKTNNRAMVEMAAKLENVNIDLEYAMFSCLQCGYLYYGSSVMPNLLEYTKRAASAKCEVCEN